MSIDTNTSALEDVFDTVDIDRINRRLDELSEIGKTSRGGITRLAYSEQENEAIDYVLDELDDEYAVEVDSTGNVFATREPDASLSIYTGSHLDTVFNGGPLDGSLGILVSLEAIDALYEADIDVQYPPTLTIFRAEESARFGYHTIGSRAALGMLEVDTFASVDQNDVPLWQAMQDAGFQPKNLSEPSIDLDRIAGFVELHIEQGRVLEEEGADVGIVSSIRAPTRYRITVTGDYDHSGATPMEMRSDALAAASEMVLAVEALAERAATEGDLVATVGDVTPIDGAINMVCGKVEFVLDIRSDDLSYRNEIETAILENLDRIADDRDVEVERTHLDSSNPVGIDPNLVSVLDSSAEVVGTDHMTIPSGGGHDAMNFQLNEIPTGMLFVPSIEGVSHNPNEETTTKAIEAATKTLACALAVYDVDRQ